MNTYIQIKDNGIYVEFNTPLDAESFETGTTLADYEAGKWVLLSPEQVAFHEAHPNATVKEVFEMQLDPGTEQPEPDELTIARKQKLQEIEEQDKYSEKFFVSVVRYQRDENGNIKVDENGDELTYELVNYTLWMDRSLRTTMLNTTLPAFQKRGDTTRKFWTVDEPSQEVSIPIQWAIDRIPKLEIYATETYDLFKANNNAAYAATSVEEIAQIDVKKDYPIFLTFELNLDLNGNDN